MNALARLDDEKRELLSRTLCVGASRDELELFFNICERTGLDPFARQIYAVRRWDKKAGREVMQTQVSIDGFRLVAQRSGEYAGQTAVAYCGTDGRWVDCWLSEEPPAAARVGVYRKGFVESVTAVALFREYAQRSKEGYLTGMWGKMPTVMIGKCAEALALRKAFPAELSGLYTPEEMAQAENPPAADPVPSAPALPPPVTVEATEMPQDAPVKRKAPKTTRATIDAPAAVPAPATPKAADNYPDEYEGEVTILRVVCRDGKPCAVQVDGEHGKAWVMFTVAEYVELARETVNEKARVELQRVDGSLTIMKWAGPVKPRKVAKEEIPF